MTFHPRLVSGFFLLSCALITACGGRDEDVATGTVSNEKQPDSSFVTSADVSDVSCAPPDGEGECARTNGALCCPVLAYRYDPVGVCWAPGAGVHDTVACLGSVSVGGTPDVCAGSGVYDCFERGEGTSHEVLITTYTPGDGDTAMRALGYTRCSNESRERVAVSGECPPSR